MTSSGNVKIASELDKTKLARDGARGLVLPRGAVERDTIHLTHRSRPGGDHLWCVPAPTEIGRRLDARLVRRRCAPNTAADRDRPRVDDQGEERMRELHVGHPVTKMRFQKRRR